MACAGESGEPSRSTEAEPPLRAQPPMEPLTEREPIEAEAPEPASIPDEVPPPKRSAVGGECHLEEAVSVAPARADRVSLALGPEGGLLAWTVDQRLTVQPVSEAGRPTGPAREEPLPGRHRLLALERLGGRFVRVLARRERDEYDAPLERLTLQVLDAAGAPVGEPRSTELSSPRVVEVVDDRLVVGGDLGVDSCCGLEHRVFRVVGDELEQTASCEGTHVCSRPGCSPPFRAVRAFAQGEDDAIVIGLAQSHLDDQIVVACDSDRPGRDYYQDLYYGDSVRSIVPTERSVALLFRHRGGFHVMRDSDWDHTEAVTPGALPDDFAELVTVSLRALPSGELDLRRYDAVRSALGEPIPIGRFVGRPRRLLDPPADFAWTGRAFVVAWAAQQGEAAAVTTRVVRCDGAAEPAD